jgi:hypothetical protein
VKVAAPKATTAKANVVRLNIGSPERLHETERSHALTTSIENGLLTCEEIYFAKGDEH